MSTKKVAPAQTSKPSTRDDRRAIVASLPADQRAVVAAITVPETQKSLAAKVAVQAAKVQAARDVPAEDPQTAALKQRALDEETKKLAGLVAAARVLEAAKQSPVGEAVIGAAAAKPRIAAVEAQKKDVAQALKDVTVEERKASNPAVQAALGTRKAQLVAQQKELEHRAGLLAHGKDVVKPARIEPARVEVQRKPLALPPSFPSPKPIDVMMVARVLTADVKPGAGEPLEAQATRIRGLTERALARKAQGEALGKPSDQALAEAVKETIRLDKPAIDAEIRAGGLVKDPAGEAMAIFVDAVAPEVVQTAVTTSPSVPASAPTPAQVDQLLTVADEIVVTAAAAPKEEWDEVREDILVGQPVAHLPLYQRPVVVVGGVGLGLGLLWWFWPRGRR